MRADDLLLNTDVPFAQWLEQDVEPRVKSHKAWAQAEASGNLTWRASRTPSETRWLSLVEDTVFGTLWDALLLNESPADALTQGALAEQLAAIGGLHRAEQAVATEAATASVDDSLAVDSTKVRHPALQRAPNLLANVVLLSKDNVAQLARTLGQLRGSIDLVTPERSKHVGIFFDVKCFGEASCRPHTRTPLLKGDATLLLLREAARARLAPWDAGGVYFLLDGGLPGDVRALRGTLQSHASAPATFRKFTTQKDLVSMCLRQHSRGDEAMLALSRSQVSLPPVKYQV